MSRSSEERRLRQSGGLNRPSNQKARASTLSDMPLEAVARSGLTYTLARAWKAPDRVGGQRRPSSIDACPYICVSKASLVCRQIEGVDILTAGGVALRSSVRECDRSCLICFARGVFSTRTSAGGRRGRRRAKSAENRGKRRGRRVQRGGREERCSVEQFARRVWVSHDRSQSPSIASLTRSATSRRSVTTAWRPIMQCTL